MTVAMSGSGHDSLMASHSAHAMGHLQTAWKVSSRSTPHRPHTSDFSKVLLCLFSIVANEFVAIRQPNTRTLGGTGHLHNALQMARLPSGALLAAHEDVRNLSS